MPQKRGIYIPSAQSCLNNILATTKIAVNYVHFFKGNSPLGGNPRLLITDIHA